MPLLTEFWRRNVGSDQYTASQPAESGPAFRGRRERSEGDDRRLFEFARGGVLLAERESR